MAYTYDLSTDVGKLRLLLPDSNAAAYVFEDADLEAFLSIEGDSLKRATALALETIASNEAMTLKVIRILDLQTDGAKTSDALLKRAGLLRSQAADEEAGDGMGWDVAEMVVDDFTWRERLLKQAQRVGG